MGTQAFDLVVIGTGSAAGTVAGRCRSAGWRVAIVDSRPFGGTCALRGCDPKKVLVAAAEAIDWQVRMTGRGVEGEALRIDWPELARTKRKFTDPIPVQREKTFADKGIAAFHGRARFVGPTTVQVGNEVLEARHLVIATGARPAPLGVPGEEHLTTSDAFLELDELPAEIAFVGGGYISFEFAHVVSRAGADVTILHRGRHPLQGFDPDLAGQLAARTRALGITIELETAVEAIEKKGKQLIVQGSTGGRKRSFEAEMVVHGAGRVPDLGDLDLARAGVEHGRRGVKVNDFLQSVSNPAVYAAGDAAETGGPPLTPVAGLEGGVVAANLLGGNQARADYTGIPSVVFTIPPLATVGLGEDEARRRDLRFRTRHEDTSGWYTSRRVGETTSGFKVLIDEETDRILGAHLLGSGADELINLFALAIRQGIPAGDLKQMLFAYPTHASDVRYML